MGDPGSLSSHGCPQRPASGISGAIKAEPRRLCAQERAQPWGMAARGVPPHCPAVLLSPCRAVGSPLVMDPNSICRKARRLAGKQAELCQTEPEIVQEAARGARLGVRECQHQFRFRRWNCTSHSKYFGRILQQGKPRGWVQLGLGLVEYGAAGPQGGKGELRVCLGAKERSGVLETGVKEGVVGGTMFLRAISAHQHVHVLVQVCACLDVCVLVCLGVLMSRCVCVAVNMHACGPAGVCLGRHVPAWMCACVDVCGC